MTTPNDNNQTNDAAVPSGYSDVYIMPENFRPKGVVGGGKSNKALIFALVFFGAIVLITGSYFAYDQWQKNQAAKTSQPTPPEVVLPLEEELLLATTTEEIATTTATTTTEVATTTATTTEPITGGQTTVSTDADSDGLTDLEEAAFGTLPANPDTDGDGYRDGNEVSSGYSPTNAGDVRLSGSASLVSLTTDFTSDNFKILYPKDWQASIVKASHQLLLTANTGEVIKITVRDNTDKLSAMSWYLSDHPQIMVSQLRLVEAGSASGIFAPDGTAAYLTDLDKTKFYVFEYLTNRQSEFRYPVLFSMLVKQFLVIANPVAVPTSTPPANQPAAINYNETEASCANFFCALSACGPTADGVNTCETAPPMGVCYAKECLEDSDCASGQTCQDVSCYVGDSMSAYRVCK